jgi:5-methylcytosine-specific restriction protein A
MKCRDCHIELEYVADCPTGWCEEHYACPQCCGTYNIFQFCVFCKMETHTRQHHVIPKSKGGRKTVSTCETCESYIHKTWTHNQLRDTYNNVETILADEGFQKFLKWRRKQPATALYKSVPGKHRDKRRFT